MMRWYMLIFSIAVTASLGGCASTMSADQRLAEVWPRVKVNVLRGIESWPGITSNETMEAEQALVSLTASIVSKRWLDAQEAWLGEPNLSGYAFLGINYAYRNSSAQNYREWERWHVREFEKSLAILTDDPDTKRGTKWLYGSLRRTTPPPHPSQQD